MALEGRQVTFTVTVTNEGPDDTRDVTVVGVLPAGLPYVSHSVPLLMNMPPYGFPIG